MSWSLALSMAEVAWTATAVIYLVLQRRSPVATVAWSLALALMPLIGIPIYVLFGPRRIARKRLRCARARANVQSSVHAREVRACDAAIRHPLARLALELGEAPPLLAHVTLCDGPGAYESILEAIRGATHHVHLEYFIFEPGIVAQRLLDALVDARKRGVEVRLLVDAIGSWSLSRRFLQPLRDAGGVVAAFNEASFASFQPWYVNFRTHRKIVVVDGRIGFTGSMNVDDLHDETLSGDASWRDLHVRLEGDAVAALQLVFLENWIFSSPERPTGPEYLPKPAAQGSCPVQIVASGPDFDSFAIYGQWLAAIASSRSRAWVLTPYFVPDEPMLAALVSAALRGVDVLLVVPEASDHRTVDAAARSYVPALRKAGARVLRLGRRRLHAKVLVVDDDFASVGTLNMDNRSFRLNFEVTASLFDRTVVESVAARVSAVAADSSAVVHPRDDERWTERFAQSGARLLSPLL